MRLAAQWHSLLSHYTAPWTASPRLGRTLTTVNNNKVNCKISNEVKPQLQRFSAGNEILKTNNDQKKTSQLCS